MNKNLINFSDSNILVVGDLMLDKYIYGDVFRISPEAPVPVVKALKEEYRVGGAGNVAINIASIGANVSLMGIVGNDKEGKNLISILKSKKIKCILETAKINKTHTKLRIISKNQQLLRIDSEEDFCSSSQDSIFSNFKKHIDEFDAVIFSDYGKGTLLNIKKLIKIAKQKNKLIFIDPKGSDYSKYNGATYITPNTNEFEQVVGECSEEIDTYKSAKRLKKHFNIDNILLTRGEKGMTLFTKDNQMIHQDTKAKSVYDVTGAGDTVIAVFAASISSGYSVKESMKLSNIAAGIVVGKIGTASATMEEVNSYIKNNFNNKIVNKSELKKIVSTNKQKGLKTVMTNGCFDIFHSGHANYLNEAKSFGNQLVVAINSDTSVAKLKGSTRPINPLAERMEVLSHIESIDWLISFEEETPENLYLEVLPDILVKAGDYKIDEIAGANHVISNGGEVKIANFIEGNSTSAIINKILKHGEGV